MTLVGGLFGNPAVDEVFSPAASVQRMLDFEAALARAESQVGVIPAQLAGPIVRHCRVALFDLDALARDCARAGNLAIPLVQQLSALVAAGDPDAARYVHWGATSQDVIDTALVLQVNQALSLIDGELSELVRLTLQLADRYRQTPVVARTWMQHAAPTVLGLEFAGWADALSRHADRLREVRRRDVVLQFGGAVGTLSSLGDRGMAVSMALADTLGLPLPAIPWHGHRDRIASIAATLALLAGTLGKIARDISLQSQSEVAELAEPPEPGRGSSSAMPHKRNPVGSAVALAAIARIPGLASSIIGGMVQEHQRGLGGWQAEWETVPGLIRLAAGSLHHMLYVVSGLVVDVARMRSNLDATRGQIFSEAAALALTPHIGRSEARALVENASRRAAVEGRHLDDLLAADPVVSKYLSSEDLRRVIDPSAHIGASREMIDRVLASAVGEAAAHKGP
jgi:3-carboxy-cis,cis-muconate cycloisomerase